ncbi:MAG: SLC13 family permease [Thermoanaerobaculia bacterium]|nr:SLC13 family permease [Thermoanaerobaculia bacterium]
MTIDVLLTLGTLVLAMLLFVSNRFRIDVVGLIVMSVVIIAGLVTPTEAISGFSNEAVMTIAAMFVLSSGLMRTGAIDVLGRWVERTAGQSEFLVLAIGLVIVIPLSAFLNNTPVVIVMIPVLLGVAKKRGVAPSRLFMPVSFASQLGGTMTLIGTSTNLLIAGLVLELGLPRIRLFDITVPGAILCAIGVVYLMTIGRHLLPIRHADEDLVETYELRDYLTVLRVLPGSPYIGKSLRDSKFGEQLGLNVVAIDRRGNRIHAPRGGTVVEEGDELLAEGKISDIAQVRENEHLDVKTPRDELFPPVDPESEKEVRLAELLVPPRSPVVGRTIRQLSFRGRYGVPVLGIQRHGSAIHQRLADVRLRAGDMLLVEATKDELQRLHTSDDIAMLGAVDPPTRRTSRMKLAVAIMIGVILVAAFEIVPIVVSALLGVVAMFVTGCVRPDEAYEDIDWMVLVLLGALIPLGIAMQKSGAADLIASQFLIATSWLGPYGALAAFYILTSLLTEVISNNAAAVVLTPIAISAGTALGVSAMPFVIAVMFAASNSFMTPVGYQTNTFIYGPGGYRFSDFLRVGAPLNVVMVAGATFVIPLFFPF